MNLLHHAGPKPLLRARTGLRCIRIRRLHDLIQAGQRSETQDTTENLNETAHAHVPFSKRISLSELKSKKTSAIKDGFSAGVIAASEDELQRKQKVIQALHSILSERGPTKREKKKKKEKEIPRVGLNPDSSFMVYKTGRKSKGKQKGKNTQASPGWPKEEWSEEWGKDALTPTETENGDTRVAPPHLRPPLPYTYRIEGLLQSSENPVLTDISPPTEQRPVAQLTHGLDRVLFNPGVHWLQDPRSRVYNFTPWLESIPKVQDFAFEKIAPFVKSSRDQDLWTLCKQENRMYGGSTSSLSGMLSHVYFLVSGDKEVNISTLSKHFQLEPATFTPGQRSAASVIFNYKDGAYAIDSHSIIPGASEKNVLTWMGTMLEKFLTVPKEEFSRLLRSSPDPFEDADPRKEAFRYSKSQRFVMRSQLDAQDTRLPGTGVFDIKTRAAAPIRLDMLNYEENSGYLIRTLQGPLESFEKEYYDLIRSAFLKYSFQVRIGNMDGVIVAYHNTARLFGFQYIPLEEMESRLYGGTGRGDRVFEKCVALLEQVADEVIKIFPDQSIQATFETLENTKTMKVWVEPVEWDLELGPRPIAQLEVAATSYVGERQVSGTRAITERTHPWTLHWSISRSSSSENDIQHELNKVRDRQIHEYNLPAGLSMSDMAEYWNNLNFGASRSESEPTTFNPNFFREPSLNVQKLRVLAREGREFTEQEEARGRRKIVWGQPDFIEDEEPTLDVDEIPEEVIEEAIEENISATDNNSKVL